MRAHGIRNTESNEEKDVKHMSKILALAAGLAVSSLAFGQVVQPSTNPGGVTPTAIAGNFAGYDDTQACYDLYGPANSQADLVGFKIDPPGDFDDSKVDVTLSADGKYLSWTLKDAKMIAVVVKGGNAYNLYNYFAHPTELLADGELQSPNELKKGKTITPQISHYNVCYDPDPVSDGDQGCTPGYWRNHADRWAGVVSTADFDETFDVDFFAPNISLGAAIWAKGGQYNALARHATAALLNAHSNLVNFRYTVQDVLDMVKGVEESGAIEDVAKELADANELGCPLSGTPALKVLF
jgi:hypothetical protein